MHLHVILRELVVGNGGEMSHDALVEALTEDQRAYAKTRFTQAVKAANLSARVEKTGELGPNGRPKNQVVYTAE